MIGRSVIGRIARDLQPGDVVLLGDDMTIVTAVSKSRDKNRVVVNTVDGTFSERWDGYVGVVE